MDTLKQGADALFILLGAIMVLAMHAGFAFLELGTVRKKNQVNALVKILVDFAISTIAYFFVGYSVAYGVDFFSSAEVLAQKNGYDLVKFFFLLTFAAAIPAIISGGIAERARFHPQSLATVLIVALVYPLSEGVAWNQKFGVQAWLKGAFGAEFHDFAGSVVVHAVGGRLVAAMMGRNDPGFVYNGPLAGLVAVCAGSDLMHPIGALVVGGVAGAIFVQLFTLTQNRWKIDDVLGVWPLHGLCGAWGGIACGLFGQTALGGLGGVSLASQAVGTLMAVAWALGGGFAVYGLIKATVGLRLSQEEEFDGADLTIHRIGATPDRELTSSPP